MSRSVSAPSSVTKTSPCWNGLMVPGSTLRYGSNFWHVTFSPRLSSRQPIDAAAMPLPSDETTPPVTNMNLAMLLHSPQRCLHQLRHPFQILRSIHAQTLRLRLHYANPIAVF